MGDPFEPAHEMSCSAQQVSAQTAGQMPMRGGRIARRDMRPCKPSHGAGEPARRSELVMRLMSDQAEADCRSGISGTIEQFQRPIERPFGGTACRGPVKWDRSYVTAAGYRLSRIELISP